MNEAQELSPEHPLAGGPLWTPAIGVADLVYLLFDRDPQKDDPKTTKFEKAVYAHILKAPSGPSRVAELAQLIDDGHPCVLTPEQELRFIELLYKNGHTDFLTKHFEAGYRAYLESHPQ